jgi:predicted regulator of amino acid metabolism with ACT domain
LAAKSANDWKKMSYENLGKAIETQKAQVQQLSETESAESKKKIADLKAMESRYKKLGSLLGLTDSNMFDGKSLIQNATSMKALANNVQYYQTQLEKADSTDRKTIQTLTEKIRVTQEAQKAVQTLVASYSRPADLSTLNRLDEEIQYQQSLLGQASESERQAIQQTIEQLERQQKVEKLNLHTAQEIGDIHTWTDLNDELTYYNDKLNLATEEERADILRIIEALNRLKQSWDDAAAELKKPGEVGTLNTIRDLNAAVNWYEQAMQRASGSELTELGKQKEAYQQKLDALKRVTMVLEQQRSLETLNGLSGKTLDMELKLVGLDQIKSNIRSLQKMLDDTKNPLDDSTRSTVQENIATWKKYERQLKKGQASYKEVWSSTKNVGSGVQSITQALKSDGKAWDKVTGVVDGALSVFDGIKDIVKMVQLLTGATQDQTSAQTEHAVATSIDAAVQGEQATATGEAALAEGVNEGALSAETNTAYEDASAHMLLAASKTMEAHAEIPFVGIAIAGGLIAAMTAILFALPKFADGGIAYGPTLGVFGEYAGAASNPEVVAPLSKLRELIGSEPDSIGGKVEFRLKGRRLVGVLERERRIQARR